MERSQLKGASVDAFLPVNVTVPSRDWSNA
jgi:hypothetical protein